MSLPTFRIKIRKPTWKGALTTVLILGVCALALGLGALTGVMRVIKVDLPNIDSPENFRPKIITRVFSESGEKLKEFAQEKRVEIPFARMPKTLVDAIVVTEDPRFFSHGGIDYWGILRALKQDIIKLGKGRPEGGSTITQQLARALFLHREVSIRRKLKELFLAREIEHKYSKENILEMYCNHFFLGNGAYGVESAANLYFGKSASDMNLEESALIAGIFRGPSLYSPYTNPKATLERRNHVLSRMAQEGYLSKDEAERAKKRPIVVLPLRRTDPEVGAYFFEEIRKYIEKNYGREALYTGGLKIYTTLDPKLQGYAEASLRSGLRDIENGQYGWRYDKVNLLAQGKSDLDRIWLDTWDTDSLVRGDVEDAIVISVSRDEAVVRIKKFTGRMDNRGLEWTRTRDLANLIKRGDIIQVRIVSADDPGRRTVVALDQDPLRNGAIMVIEPQTGRIKAMVGGYSFRKSQFNRAVQAQRQTGSAIKPFLYTAALENGFTAATRLMDEPKTFIDSWSGEPWTPKNYDRKFKGAVTFRIGLEESRNVVTAQLLENISPQVGVDYCRRFGITSPVYPYLSLSLGTFEVNLEELVSAYSVFPNKGVRVKPYFISRIEDADGNILEENIPETTEVLSPQTAYIMTSILQGVITSGTGGSAASLGWPLGGKTGTTDDCSDAWFMGFSPTLCAGVWVGHDNKVSLGKRQTGATAALPIWKDFFARVIEDKKRIIPADAGPDYVVENFEVPPNLVFVEIDRKTGLLAVPGVCRYPFNEVFLTGTEPKRFCSNLEHMKILDYYSSAAATEEH